MPMMLIGTGGPSYRERDFEARVGEKRELGCDVPQITDPEEIARRDPRDVTALPHP